MIPARSLRSVANTRSPVRLQARVAALQDVMQIDLLSFDQSELCVELRPRPCSDRASNDLEPLRLSVTWSHGDRFRLQVTTAAHPFILAEC